MKLPRVKDIRSKFSSAKLLGIVVKNSLQFKLRRRALKRFKATNFDTVIVDMDGTLYKGDVSLEGLKLFYGEVGGEEIYDSLISKIASGQYTIEQAIVEGNKFLMKKQVSKNDFASVFEKVKPGIRKSLIKALKKLKNSGKTLVLATLSSKEFGELLNSYLREEFDFCFDYVLGTELIYGVRGRIKGVKSIVSTKDSRYKRIPVKSKLSMIRNVLEGDGLHLDLKKTLLVTDSYSDIDLAKMVVTILIKPSNPTTAQKVSQRLKLADYILADDKYLKTNLESIILGPEK